MLKYFLNLLSRISDILHLFDDEESWQTETDCVGEDDDQDENIEIEKLWRLVERDIFTLRNTKEAVISCHVG